MEEQMNLRKNPVLNAIIIIIVVGGGIFYFNYDMAKKDKLRNQIFLEFPRLELSDSIVGVITNIYYPDLNIFRFDSSFARVQINNTQKIRIWASREIRKRFPIHRQLQVGDSIIKKAGSDSLILVKKKDNATVKYYFKILNDRGYPLKSGNKSN